MKIVLIGYGKMGKAVQEVAESRGHTISSIIRSENKEELKQLSRAHVDVAIEFTSPDAAPGNIYACLMASIPVITGSTGWDRELDTIRKLAEERKVGFLHASNFSIGMNLFFEINKRLAGFMNHQPDYKISMKEIHHTAKKDKPSGTAITLAEDILQNIDRMHTWRLSEGNIEDGVLPIEAIRVEDVPGIHTVTYTSPADQLMLTHTAFNRIGFASGAVLAAEFIVDKQGVYTMREVLGF